ncbi:MAG: hypothetical protein R3A12_04425 [Ignavibacteria bacterium]
MRGLFLLPNKCAIGFVGTRMEFRVGDNYNDQMLRNFSVDSARRIGDMVTYASKRLSTIQTVLLRGILSIVILS